MLCRLDDSTTAGHGTLDSVIKVANQSQIVLDVTDTKPLDALQRLKQCMPTDEAERLAWRNRARVAAVLGSRPSAKACFISGISACRFITVCVIGFCAQCCLPGLRHWIKFIEIVHGQDAAASVALPPRLDDVLAWSHTFRCVSTFELA